MGQELFKKRVNVLQRKKFILSSYDLCRLYLEAFQGQCSISDLFVAIFVSSL